MSAADQHHLDRFIAHLPARAQSFADRGATVPFTTPALAAARLRRLGGTAELLLPAPGGRGTCVLDWGSCLGLAPTLHDRDLWQRLAASPRATPRTVRAAARASAATGLAGRAAQAAARAADAAEATARQALERRFAALGAAAPLLAEALAPAFGPDGRTSPVETRLDRLARFAEAANGAALGAGPPSGREASRLLASAARLALSAAGTALAALRQAVDALPVEGAAGTEAGVARILALAERPDWLLDGWCLPVALGSAPGAAGPEEVLAGLAPPAQEAEAWWSSAGGWEAVLDGRTRLALRPGWSAAPRTEAVPWLEAARAAAA